MRRRLLNVLTAVSLVLCAAVAALWVRSHFVAEDFHWQWHRGGGEFRGVAFKSSGGGAALRFYSASFADPAALALARAEVERKPLYRVANLTPRYPRWSNPRWQVLGLQWAIDAAAGPPFRPTRVLVLPYWSLTLLAAALPTLRLATGLKRRRRLRRLKARGRCPACGYDLRATPGRCPECGTVTPARN